MATRARRGFTLIEVLVALMIFAIVALVLSSAYLNVLTSYEIVGRGTGEDQDVAFARDQLLQQPDLNTAEAGDEFDTADPDTPRHVVWTSDIEPTTTANLFTVTFTCTISSSLTPEPRKIVETFMLLRPTWSVATDLTTDMQAAITKIQQLQGKAPP